MNGESTPAGARAWARISSQRGSMRSPTAPPAIRATTCIRPSALSAPAATTPATPSCVRCAWVRLAAVTPASRWLK